MRRLGTGSTMRLIVVVVAVTVPLALAWRWASLIAALLAAVLVAFVVLVAAAILVLPGRLVSRDVEGANLPAELRASAVNSARGSLIQGMVGLAALAGILVAWQQLQADREQTRTDRHQLTEQLTLTRQGQVAERFTRAIDQLGSDRLAQRLGGIYGLEQISKESPGIDIRLVVSDVLTAFVRQHAPHDRTATADDRHLLELGVRAPDVQAAMTVLGRRVILATDPQLDLRYVDLRRADLQSLDLHNANLAGAQLIGATLSNARLQGANLRDADLQWATFTNALLQDADLNRAQLQNVVLSHARLQGAQLNGARLQDAKFIGAQLHLAGLADAQLRGAVFLGAHLPSANLAGAQLQNANLTGAILVDAELGGANLGGAQLQSANLVGARLQGAECTSLTRWPPEFDWRAAGVTLIG
jgi:uncharacterized protein YjbI with pentapeptide repeats